MCPTLTVGSFFTRVRSTFLFICSVWPKHTANLRTSSKIIKPTSRTLKTTKDPHFGYLGVFNLDFFSALWDFFLENFLIVPKGPTFQIFQHYETVQNCHFSSDIRFSQYISTNIFFQYYPKFDRNIRSKALYPNFWRYFRSIFCLAEEEAEVRKQVLAFVPAPISELLNSFPSTEGFLWLKLFCEFFIKKRHEHILKILHFLSLRYSTNFGRSRLVYGSPRTMNVRCLAWESH